ncbi:MAG: hypothetical protein EPN97_17135 [Alphaproteobacteria bacterium]|nr:MAG: hypothetical protein EPN97_17135 [Alphaproteobacteria bacterium]
MADDLDRLKERLWKQFHTACNAAENTGAGTLESRARNRNAAGTLGLAIVAAERELREREQEKKTFSLVGKDKAP